MHFEMHWAFSSNVEFAEAKETAIQIGKRKIWLDLLLVLLVLVFSRLICMHIANIWNAIFATEPKTSTLWVYQTIANAIKAQQYHIKCIELIATTNAQQQKTTTAKHKRVSKSQNRRASGKKVTESHKKRDQNKQYNCKKSYFDTHTHRNHCF